MADFLLELRCEEIPARMQVKAADDLVRLFGEKLAEAGLTPAAVTPLVTPRRLALIATGLPLETQAVSEEFKGPRTSAPAQALEGFLRKTGLTQDQMEDRDGVWFATVEKPGRATADVLADAVPAIIRAFPWPKSMRWGTASRTTESLRWVRPLQGIVALLDGAVVPMAVDGITSGRETVGHRFHSSGPIAIESAATYADQLRAAHVIVDHKDRCQIIETTANALAAEAGLSLIPDVGLVAENAGLTEWPVPLLGRFDPAFLEVPPEVIQLTLRVNQKYFVLRDAAGKLANAFICTANIEAKDGGAAIVAGNGKVLAARLSDARFFWEQDKKTPLADHAKKLERITFHEKLGTVADKVERVAKLARWLVEEGIIKGADPDEAEQAARLCKADLVTDMVGEFPELQGLMGGYYARAETDANGARLNSDAVADAIRDHYKPVGQGDDVPTAPVTVAVSLADKLDTIAGFFLIGDQPSGSRDPFALRRAAISVSGLLATNQLRLRLLNAFANAIVAYAETAIIWIGRIAPELEIKRLKLNRWTALREFATNEGYFEQFPTMPTIDLLSVRAPFELLDRVRFATPETMLNQIRMIATFIIERLKVQQREAGVRHDLIDAVFALGGEDDLVRLLARVHALQAFITTDDGTNLLAGYKRAANILKKEAPATVDQSQAGEEDPGIAQDDADVADALRAHEALGIEAPIDLASADMALRDALDRAGPVATTAIAEERFGDAMAALAGLRGPIDSFFTDVMVNDADPAKRAYRLALLARFRDAVHQVADFSRIEG